MAVNQLKAGAALNYVIIGLNALLGLLYTPYMLRMLGQNEYGLYSLVASIIAYLTILDFGFGNAIVRYTAKFRTHNDNENQSRMFGLFLIVYSVVSLITVAIGGVLFLNIDNLFDRTMTTDEISQAKIMLGLLIFNMAATFPLSVFGSIITAYEHFVFQKSIQIVRLLLSTGVIILLLFMGYKAVAMVVVQTVFNISVLVINYVYCRKKLGIRLAFRRPEKSFIKEISIYSFWIFLNTIMDRIYWSTGQFILGAVSGTVAVAVFSLAILLQQMYMSFSGAISGVLLPKITSIIALNKSYKEVSDIFIRTGRIQCLVIIFILSGFIVFGNQFIYFWAGRGYSETYAITLIFFISLFIPLIQNTGIIILQARNQMKFRSLLYLYISICSLAAQILLSKAFGPVGCAWAVGMALIVGQGVIMNFYYRRVQHIDIGRFWIEIGKICLMPILFTVLSCVVIWAVDIANIWQLLVAITVYTSLFILILWKFSMNLEEHRMISKPVNRIASALLHKSSGL